MDGSDELSKEVSCWDLASDAKLLAALNRFSTSICQKSKALLDTVDNLHYNTIEAECDLRNTFNEFLTLADTQFIENVRFRFKCISSNQRPIVINANINIELLINIYSV